MHGGGGSQKERNEGKTIYRNGAASVPNFWPWRPVRHSLRHRRGAANGRQNAPDSPAAVSRSSARTRYERIHSLVPRCRRDLHRHRAHAVTRQGFWNLGCGFLCAASAGVFLYCPAPTSCFVICSRFIIIMCSAPCAQVSTEVITHSACWFTNGFSREKESR